MASFKCSLKLAALASNKKEIERYTQQVESGNERERGREGGRGGERERGREKEREGEREREREREREGKRRERERDHVVEQQQVAG